MLQRCTGIIEYNEPVPDGSVRTPIERMNFWATVREDLAAHGGDWSRPGFQAVFVHRFGVWRMGVNPKVLRAPLSMTYRTLYRVVRNVYGIELPYSARLGRRVVFEHQHGIVVHGNSVIGDDCIIRHGVTLGIRSLDRLADAPVLGRGVNVGAGAKIVGHVRIGDGASIGANAVVLEDIPDGALAVGVPARVVARTPQMAAMVNGPDDALERGRNARRRPVGEPIHVLVVIVNYKTSALTLRCLESVERERNHPGIVIQAVVIENASGDSAALAQGIEQRFASWARLIDSPVNGGFGAGNNLGFRAAFESGNPPDYFHILNPDTEVREGGIAELVRFLEDHPRAGLAGSNYENADGSPWPAAFRFPTPLGEVESGVALKAVSRLLAGYAVFRRMGDHPESVDWLPGASMMLRRKMIEQIGGFDEGYFLYYEETDLCRRAAAAGWECWFVPTSHVMHIRGQSTGVTVLGGPPRRLPGYWFESRRRYYTANHGVPQAVLADLAFLTANGLGMLKKKLRGENVTPFLLRDFVRNSVVWPQNRTPAPRRCYRPKRTADAEHPSE